MSLVLNRNFWLLWANRILNRMAYQLAFFTSLVWVYQLTGSNSAVSLFMAMFIISSVSFSLIAGVAADVYDRRKLIIFSNIIWGILILLLIPAQNSFSWILIITLVTQALDEFFNPSQGSLLPSLVEDKKLLSANSIVQIAIFGASAFGYFLSGVLFRLVGYPAPFAVAAGAVFLAGLLAIFLPPLKHAQPSPSFRQFFGIVKQRLLTQLDFLLHEKNVTATVVLLSAVTAMATGASAILPGFAEEVLKIDARDISIVGVLPLALGVISATIVLMRRGGGMKVWQAVLGLGATVVVASLSGPLRDILVQNGVALHSFEQLPLFSLWVAFLAFVLGIFVSYATIPTITSLQRITPAENLGRTLGSSTLLYSFFTGIFVLTFGAAADLFDPTVPLAFVGFLAVLAAFWVRTQVVIK